MLYDYRYCCSSRNVSSASLTTPLVSWSLHYVKKKQHKQTNVITVWTKMRGNFNFDLAVTLLTLNVSWINQPGDQNTRSTTQKMKWVNHKRVFCRFDKPLEQPWMGRPLFCTTKWFKLVTSIAQTSGKGYVVGFGASCRPKSSTVPHFGMSSHHTPVYICPRSR